MTASVTDTRAEVCVIGTGAGGAAAACALAESGRDVVLLEAGGHHTAADMDQREETMLPRLFQEDGRRGTIDGSIPILQGRAVGGSTTHNTGYVYRTPPGIFERWRREAGFDLPDAEVESLYRDLERAIAVTPCREEDVNALNGIVRRGARALGWRVRRTSHNRAPACSGCGYCLLGCAYNRKQSALVTFVPRALAAGARLRADAPVERLERAGSGWRVRGPGFAIQAERVIVAAGAIDTPLILERSGLAGGSGSVRGRTLRLHPAAPVGASFDEEVVAWRGVPQSVMVEEFATFFETGRGGYLLMPANCTPALTAALLPGVGLEHRAHMRDLRRFASGAVLLHDETCGSVRPRGTGGLRPAIRYWPDAEDLRELLDGVRNLARLFFAAGAKRVLLPFVDCTPIASEAEIAPALARGRTLPHLFALSSVHPQATCPLGARPEQAVVRPDLALHDPAGRGVFVGDASAFAGSVGVPPQLTAMLMGRIAARSAGAFA